MRCLAITEEGPWCENIAEVGRSYCAEHLLDPERNKALQAEVSGPSPVAPKELEGGPESLFGPILHAYTRAQAIDDGVLVDCGCFMWGGSRIVDVLGFRYPVAMTAGAWGAITEGCEVGTAQDKVALAACLRALKDAIKAAPEGGDTIHFRFEPLMAPGVFVELWSLCGPGDTPEPVLTIMLEGED